MNTSPHRLLSEFKKHAFIWCSFFLFTPLALALEEEYTLTDGNVKKAYIVAQDELECIPSNGSKEHAYLLKGKTSIATLVTQAKTLSSTTDNTFEIVLYPLGDKKKSIQNRRTVSPEVLVELTQGQNAKKVFKESGAKSFKTLDYLPSYIILTFSDSWTSLKKSSSLKDVTGVKDAQPLLKKQNAKKAATNDPFYEHNPSNSGYQWHLKNTGARGGVVGVDVNIEDVWDTYKGDGITVGIIDDGMQTNHPDLIANTNTLIDQNWNNGDPNDPSPGSGDTHGTPCAGVTASVGNNGIGGTGAAPNATLVGLRLIAGGVTDSDEAAALSWENTAIEIKSNSWGPTDAEGTLDAPGTITSAALANSVNTGRGGRGTIHVWAAGNGGDNDNVNYDAYANSIYTIAIGAVDDQGNRSWYSEPGSAKLVSAPSNGGIQGITTTQIGSTYTYSFGGTSSATPLVSGIVALLLEANPNLGWRDVQEILIRCAQQNKPSDPSWAINGAGTPFSHEFGAGIVDAELAIKMAESWTNLGTQQSSTTNATGLPLAVPDNNVVGQSTTFTIGAGNNFRVEHITLDATITHPERGDLTVSLTSPSGTTSILGTAGTGSGANYSNWKFMSVFNWGEESQGTWTLNVKDSTGGNTGTLNAASLKVFGAPILTPTTSPVFVNNTTTTEDAGIPFHFKVFAKEKVTSYTATGLPSGLTINTVTGAITGTPSTPGTYNATVSATNAIGTTNSPLTIILTDPNSRAPSITSSATVSNIFGNTLLYQLTADYAPTSYTASPLPSGVNFNSSTGVLSGTPSIGTYTITLSASNSFGSDSISLTLNVIRNLSDAYAEALENTSITFFSPNTDLNNPSTYWNYQTTTAQIDNDALESHSIADNESTTVTGTFPESGIVEFWAKASTEAGYDVFTADTSNNLTFLKLSGENDWKKFQYYLPRNGNLNWTYNKDNSASSGSNKVWLDEVTFSPLSLPNGVIATAVDFLGLDLTPSREFIMQLHETNDGEDALQFPIVGNSESATLTTSVVGPGTLEFYYKVSSETGYDFFQFSIDSTQKVNVSGNGNWIKHTEVISAGTHSLEWKYSKDGSADGLLDTAYIDQLTWTCDNSSDYQNWTKQHFSPTGQSDSAISGNLSDPDGDGIPNLLEYAFGNSPISETNANLPVYSQVGADIVLDYPVDMTSTDVNITGQFSTNLSGWTLRNHTVISTNGDIQTRRISYPIDLPRAFLRLEAIGN